MHHDAAKQMKAISADLEKQGSLSGMADHPQPSEKTKQAMGEVVTQTKALIALLQKDVDESEKMMNGSGGKAGGTH
jgi:hypothetical protein